MNYETFREDVVTSMVSEARRVESLLHIDRGEAWVTTYYSDSWHAAVDRFISRCAAVCVVRSVDQDGDLLGLLNGAENLAAYARYLQGDQD